MFADAADGSSIPQGDAAAYLFFTTWIATFFALVIVAMYRFAPWIARLLGDSWEAKRIRRDEARHVSVLEWLAAGALVVRAIITSIDASRITLGTVAMAAFALVPFVVPRPRSKRAT